MVIGGGTRFAVYIRRRTRSQAVTLFITLILIPLILAFLAIKLETATYASDLVQAELHKKGNTEAHPFFHSSLKQVP